MELYLWCFGANRYFPLKTVKQYLPFLDLYSTQHLRITNADYNAISVHFLSPRNQYWKASFTFV